MVWERLAFKQMFHRKQAVVRILAPNHTLYEEEKNPIQKGSIAISAHNYNCFSKIYIVNLF
jgi:hypothetical protein